MIVGLYAALASAFLIFLSLRVIGIRRRRKISVGHNGDPELERAMRVQANFTEYTPLALLMLALVETEGHADWAIHALGLALSASRLLHFLGFRSAEAPGIFRLLGMVGTFGVLAVLAVMLALRSFH